MIENIIQSDRIKDTLQRNNVSWLGLLGSYSRGEEDNHSDIDLMVNFSKKISLLAHIKLQRELSELIGKKIDLITENSISPYMREKIMNDLKVIYDAKR